MLSAESERFEKTERVLEISLKRAFLSARPVVVVLVPEHPYIMNVRFGQVIRVRYRTEAIAVRVFTGFYFLCTRPLPARTKTAAFVRSAVARKIRFV